MMKFKKQNQHGAWAMVFMPPVLGMVAGGFHWSQLFYLVGWLLVFFAADHILYFIKRFKRKEYEYLKSSILFLVIAAVLFIYPLIVDYRIIYFFIAMIPFGLINSYFSYTKNERTMINNLSAIMIFAIAGGGVAFLSLHALTFKIFFVIIISFLYFTGTTFVVKTVIREKNNPAYKWASFIYHGLLFLAMLIWHYILGIAFLFGLIRAVYVYGRGWRPKQLGILEIIHAVYVTVFVSIFMVYFM